MDSPIERRICGEPSAFFRPEQRRMGMRAFCGASAPARRRIPPLFLELAVAVLAAPFACGQSAVPSYVDNCQPCTVPVGGTAGTYSFTFALKSGKDGRIVEAIDVAKDQKPVQRLRVTGMEPLDEGDQFFFGGVDLNFDGLADVMLMTRKGAANAYAMYWLFDPKTGTFTELGTYPMFRVDAEKHRLSTYERGGSAGLIHESKEYAFEDGKLVLMRDEKQSAAGQPGVFRKIVKERRGGAMAIVANKTVHGPKSD
jgi:hypothetical protein